MTKEAVKRPAKGRRKTGSKVVSDVLDSRVTAMADIKLAQDLKKYTHQIWLAGLGAFSRAEVEGGKGFEKLVKTGEEIENRTRDEVRRQIGLANSKVGDVRSVAENKVEEMKSKATDTWDKVERVFDDRVSRALKRLGVPTRKDVEALQKQVEALTEQVSKLDKK